MKRLLIRLLVASCCLVALSYAAVFAGARDGWAPWTLAIGANGVIMSLMAIGAVRHDTLPRSLVWTFIGLFALCAGAFLAALALPSAASTGRESGRSWARNCPTKSRRVWRSSLIS